MRVCGLRQIKVTFALWNSVDHIEHIGLDHAENNSRLGAETLSDTFSFGHMWPRMAKWKTWPR